MTFTENKWHNNLLATIPENDRAKWLKALEPVQLEAGDVVCEIGSTFHHVYFPTTSILSLTQFLIEGDTIEVAMIGSEGMSGISMLLGGGLSQQQVVVLHSGIAYRALSSWVTEEVKRSPQVMHQILRFAQSLITQMSQLGACNRRHSIVQQLSRWLLSYADRANSDTVSCTQETIAHMLGVRRERIARAALELQKDSLIQYSRGRIKILSKETLALRTCECYTTIKSEYERLRPLHRLN
jgi:CRP-like cAMP-binding protein